MPKQPKRSVLLDTSFLITLFDNSRTNHDNAKKYYMYFIENKIDMYLSVIAISEYSQKDSIEDILNTGNFISLTMTVPDGITAGNFAKLLSSSSREAVDSRMEAKDDIKLLAQCSNNAIDYIATDDSSTLAKYTRRLNENGDLATKVITMNAYDTSVLNGGQLAIDIDEDSK
ncbi:MAG: hypothetical protein FWD27_07935 [Coriobacteriia bacterium]|nr:hypothetical protein [Coriobacteriia bacterium]